MSTRTIIEINHDCLTDIACDPDALSTFIAALGVGLDWAEHKKPNGITILRQRHHSEKVKLVVE